MAGDWSATADGGGGTGGPGGPGLRSRASPKRLIFWSSICSMGRLLNPPAGGLGLPFGLALKAAWPPTDSLRWVMGLAGAMGGGASGGGGRKGGGGDLTDLIPFWGGGGGPEAILR